MDKLIYTVWLSLCCTPSSPTFARLTEKFNSAEEVYLASDRDIRAAIGANVCDVRKILEKDLSGAEQVYTFCKTKKVGILTYYDKEYPDCLKDIPTPPVLLYYRGKLPDFNSGTRIGTVGSRTISGVGRTSAFNLGYDLAKSGATVVSGMASGIDGIALAGALAAGGKTVAVIGSGIDICYPLSHLTLAREIVKEGCIFTEYPPSTKPYKSNFPKRNRIIAALSNSVAVVQAKVRSGALITADYAKEYNKTVYAFPGNALDPLFVGNNYLIKNGAKLILGADDIVRDYEKDGSLNPFKLEEKRSCNMESVLSELKVSALWQGDDVFNPGKKKTVTSNENYKSQDENLNADFVPEGLRDKKLIKLYKKIPCNDGCSIDFLVDEEFDLRAVMSYLLKLEIEGYAEMLPGDRVRRKSI